MAVTDVFIKTAFDKLIFKGGKARGELIAKS